MQFKPHRYLHLGSGFAHLVVTQVHHEHRERILGFSPHVRVTVLQAGVEVRNTQGEVSRNGAQAGQLFDQPA